MLRKPSSKSFRETPNSTLKMYVSAFFLGQFVWKKVRLREFFEEGIRGIFVWSGFRSLNPPKNPNWSLKT
jgi:hypothetical protein